ncbi:MAG: FAD-binding oxidoreductase [Candidatus Eisenbacteria bacterium]
MDRPQHQRLARDPEICAAASSDASGLSHVPDGLARPRNEEEVRELVRLAGAFGEPVTAQGLRSSTTGSSVAFEGVALSLESMDRVLSIDPEALTARVEAGVNLGDLKRRLAEHGLFYPPDPTSENECTVGGTVATNASGSRSYRYGATRPWIRGLSVVTADGTPRRISRVAARKNATGYFGLQDPIDLFIGSEGTLGIVTEVELRLLPAPPEAIAGFAFFRDWREAIRFVLAADASPQFSPRCLELFDRTALDLVRDEPGGSAIPEDAGAAISFEEEAGPEREEEVVLRWIDALSEATPLVERAFLAQSTADKQTLRTLRHAIPARMNEAGARVVLSGGRKISTDFAVPLAHLETMMDETYRLGAERFPGMVIGYGHVGSGHPHFNFLAEDPAKLEIAEEMAMILARRAIELGGTLSAEHGIGKVKAHLFRELYPDWMVGTMRAIKERLDPKWILAPGNLFEETR